VSKEKEQQVSIHAGFNNGMSLLKKEHFGLLD
jgi:hypothetical protein